VAIVVAALALLVVSGVDRGGVETDTERIQRLTESFACPQCNGESVAESNAAVSATIREFIANEVTAGATDAEIRDQLVAGYGTKVLRNPPADGVATLLWVLPVLLVVGGAAGVTTMASRRGPRAGTASEADRALVSQARRSSGPDAVADEGL
jgi:cytochrome c-type biogenesis protein CcmH